MVGLLGVNTSGRRLGLLSPNVGATDEAMRRHRERQAAERAAQAPAAPQRERVNPLRVFDRVLGGQTVSEGLDAERARLEAEAMRPQMEAQRQQVLQTITDPRERALFMTDPAAWAENVGYQFRPRTLAPGSVERLGGETVGAAPVVERFDDRFGMFDPLNPQAGAQYTAPRGPTYDEETGRAKVEQDARQFDSRLALDQSKLSLDAELGRGGLNINRQELGIRQDEAARQAQERDRAEREQASAVVATADNMAGALTRAREYAGSAGAYQFLNPLNRQGRANLEANLDTLKGNLTFDKLMEMKLTSPTGASGLGALSDNEARLLASTVAALSADMDPRELERSFTVIDSLIAKMRDSSGGPAQGGITREQAIAEARRRGLIR